MPGTREDPGRRSFASWIHHHRICSAPTWPLYLER
jgi:hypothetical protein